MCVKCPHKDTLVCVFRITIKQYFVLFHIVKAVLRVAALCIAYAELCLFLYTLRLNSYCKAYFSFISPVLICSLWEHNVQLSRKFKQSLSNIREKRDDWRMKLKLKCCSNFNWVSIQQPHRFLTHHLKPITSPVSRLFARTSQRIQEMALCFPLWNLAKWLQFGQQMQEAIVNINLFYIFFSKETCTLSP